MESSAARRRPVGMILVEAGAITVDDLVNALAEQRRTRRRLGEILIDSGLITWLQLAEAIAEQARDLDPEAAAEHEPELEPEPELPVPVQSQPERELQPEPEPVAEAEPEPVAEAKPEPVAEAEPEPMRPVPIVVKAAPEPPLSEAEQPSPSVVAASGGRPDVEHMLMERQRAFMELVSVTETLRATITRLQDELAERDAEIARLRSMSLPAVG
jgi:outer membrane biosynthesis protein TonB